jgi:hypothetical protein
MGRGAGSYDGTEGPMKARMEPSPCEDSGRPRDNKEVGGALSTPSPGRTPLGTGSATLDAGMLSGVAYFPLPK